MNNPKDGDSSAVSMLAVPNPISRTRASSAPESRQATERNEGDEDIEDLVGGLGGINLGKDWADSPSSQKLTRNRRGRKPNSQMGNVPRDGDGRGHESPRKRTRKPQDADQVASNTRAAQALDVPDSREGGNLLDGSAPSLSRLKAKVSESTRRSSSRSIDAPVLPTAELEERMDQSNSLPEPNVIADTIPESDGTTSRKTKKSSNIPSEGIESLLQSQTPQLEDLESAPLDTSLSLDSPEPKQATSSTSKGPKPRKSKPRTTSRSTEDPPSTFTLLEPFHPKPRTKRDLKKGILHTLLDQKHDPKPVSKSDVKVNAKKDTKADATIDATADAKTGGKTATKPKPPKNKYDDSPGYIYIFTSPSYPGYFKIGKTKKHPDGRITQWAKQCNFVATHISDPKDQSFRRFSLVETLVQQELYNERRKFQCGNCKTNHGLPLVISGQKMKVDEAISDQKPSNATEHGEWYDVSEGRALAVVQRWRTWVVQNQPYWEDGSLRDKWMWKVSQAQNSVEMEWVRWIQTKLPKWLQKLDSVERDWDWDRWMQMRWDDWLCYLFYRLDLEVRSMWRPLMNFLWHPGLLVWCMVGAAPVMAYSACGGGQWGLCASLGVISAILASWMRFGC